MMKNNCHGSFHTPSCSWKLVTDHGDFCFHWARTSYRCPCIRKMSWGEVCKWETWTSDFRGCLVNIIGEYGYRKGWQERSEENPEWVGRPVSGDANKMDELSSGMWKALGMMGIVEWDGGQAAWSVRWLRDGSWLLWRGRADTVAFLSNQATQHLSTWGPADLNWDLPPPHPHYPLPTTPCWGSHLESSQGYLK